MDWCTIYSRWFCNTHLDELAGEISHRCAERVWSKVEPRAGRLGPTQARGYIRARASLIVKQEVERCLADRPGLLPSAVSERLRQMVADKVVDGTLRSVLHTRQATSARRAA